VIGNPPPKYCGEACRHFALEKRAASQRKTRICKKCGCSYQFSRDHVSSLFCKDHKGGDSKKKTREEKLAVRRAYVKAHPDIYKNSSKRWYLKLRETNPHKWSELMRKRREAQKAWAKTPEGRKLYLASLRRCKHRRRARLRDSCSPGVPARFWLAVCQSNVDAEGRTLCTYCKKPCNPTVDHVVPISRGGRDEPGNVVAACSFCNTSKASHLIHEWPRARQFFQPHEIAAFAEAYARCGIA
jgi:5-methylcytosine-specific restriction endonuclease McrA